MMRRWGRKCVEEVEIEGSGLEEWSAKEMVWGRRRETGRWGEEKRQENHQQGGTKSGVSRPTKEV